jgi:hypothetical protein
MAFDDIVKALTIQITADDLTGGMWSSVGKNISEAQKSVIALNQAWELGIKIYETVGAALEKPIAILSAGGEYSEARAGFEALANSYNVNGQSIVNSLRDIAEGTIGLQEATQAASNAIKKGYSAEQIEVIAAFSKKYSDVVGGDFLSIAADIEQALATGQLKTIKQYDLAIAKGQDMASVMDIIKQKTEAMGSGAFNFGDAWKGIGQSAADALLEISGRLSDLAGSAGFGGLAESFRRFMAEIENQAPEIAAGVFRPIIDAAQIALPQLIDIVSGFFDMAFDRTDSLAVRINTMVIFVGNAIYDVIRLAENAWNLFAVIPTKSIQGWINMIGMIGSVEMMGKSILSESTLTSIDKLNKSMDLFLFDTAELDRRQKAFNLSATESSIKSKEFNLNISELSGGLGRVGQNFEKTTEQADKFGKIVSDAKKQVRDLNIEMIDGVYVKSGTGNTSTGKQGGSPIWEPNEFGFIGFDGKDAGFTRGAKTTGGMIPTVDTGDYGHYYIGNGISYSGSLVGITGNPDASIIDSKGRRIGGRGAAGGKGGGMGGGSGSVQTMRIIVDGSDGKFLEIARAILDQATIEAVADGLVTAGV